MRLASLLVPVAVLAAPSVASAHIELMNPAPRQTTSIKIGPCGDATTPRSSSPTVLEPGATITVAWQETIGHPGHYRISFDEDGQDFTVPLDFNDTSQSENVLVDMIADVSGTTVYHQEITLPDVECESCTLQLIQMMTDKPPYGDGNDLYFQCADLALRAGGGPDPVGPDAGGGGDDPGDDDGSSDDGSSNTSGGCSAGADGTTFAFFAGVLGSVFVMGRRRGVAPKRTER